MGRYDEDEYEELLMMGIDPMENPMRHARAIGGRDFWGGRFHGPVDLEGKLVKRTKRSHPYTYDGHVIHRMRANAEVMECEYTDRLAGWDREKYQRLAKEHLNRRWDMVQPREIENFLRAWNEDPGLELIAVMEWCNQATGYPTWSLHFVFSSKKLEEMAEEAKVRSRARGCANYECRKKFVEGDEVIYDESRGYPQHFHRGCEPKEEYDA